MICYYYGTILNITSNKSNITTIYNYANQLQLCESNVIGNQI